MPLSSIGAIVGGVGGVIVTIAFFGTVLYLFRLKQQRGIQQPLQEREPPRLLRLSENSQLQYLSVNEVHGYHQPVQIDGASIKEAPIKYVQEMPSGEAQT